MTNEQKKRIIEILKKSAEFFKAERIHTSDEGMVTQHKHHTESGSGNHEFSAHAPHPIDMDHAQHAQEKLGYHPAGYGIHHFKTGEKDGKHTATWQCSNSCD